MIDPHDGHYIQGTESGQIKANTARQGLLGQSPRKSERADGQKTITPMNTHGTGELTTSEVNKTTDTLKQEDGYIKTGKEEAIPSDNQKKVFWGTKEKLERSQKLKEEIIPYLEKNHPHLLANKHRSHRIRECCNQIAFRRYLESGDVQLVSANFCKYDRICIACATKRAMRMIKKFSQGIKEHKLYTKKWYYIVLTIRHKREDSLTDLMDRLMLYKERLARAYRNSKRNGQKTKSFFNQFDGMAISIEIAHKGDHGRHPHINILACSDNTIPIESKYSRGLTNPDLRKERETMTDGTSYVHNIRHIEVRKDHFTRSGIGEVFKYAIKFSDLGVGQLAEVMAIQHCKKYHFFATYGIFRGWKIGEGFTHEGDRSEGVFLYNGEEYQQSHKNRD